MALFQAAGPIPKGKWVASATLDSTKFEQMLRDLSTITGKSLEKVIKAETASFLAKALQKTGVSNPVLVKLKFTYTENGPNSHTIPFVTLRGKRVRVRSIKKRGMWVQQKKGPVWKPDKVNPMWWQLQDKLKYLHNIAKKRKGLAKATWLRIAQTAKLPQLTKPKPPVYAYTALRGFTQRLKSATGGKQVNELGGKTYYILIRNYSTTAMAPKHENGPGGYGAFKKAMRGRVDHFNYSMAKGAFKTAEKMAAKYPGILVTGVKS